MSRALTSVFTMDRKHFKRHARHLGGLLLLIGIGACHAGTTRTSWAGGPDLNELHRAVATIVGNEPWLCSRPDRRDSTRVPHIPLRRVRIVGVEPLGWFTRHYDADSAYPARSWHYVLLAVTAHDDSTGEELLVMMELWGKQRRGEERKWTRAPNVTHVPIYTFKCYRSPRPDDIISSLPLTHRWELFDGSAGSLLLDTTHVVSVGINRDAWLKYGSIPALKRE